MNTFSLTFGFNEVPGPLQAEVLRIAELEFGNQKFFCQRGSTSGNILAATGDWKNYLDLWNGMNTGSFGLVLREVQIRIYDAVVPWPSRGSLRSVTGLEEYRHGGLSASLDPLGSSLDRKFQIYCDSDKKYLEVCTQIPYEGAESVLRELKEVVAYLDMTAKMTKAAQKLIRAYRVPNNPGFVDRATKELFESIGDAVEFLK
jgi:hypothetical protein